MSTVTLYPSGPPTGVDLGEAGAVVTNYGAGSVSYSDTAEPFVAEGTIAATATATLSGTQFFRATTGAVLGIVELDASLGSLEAIRAQLLAVEIGQVSIAARAAAIESTRRYDDFARANGTLATRATMPSGHAWQRGFGSGTGEAALLITDGKLRYDSAGAAYMYTTGVDLEAIAAEFMFEAGATPQAAVGLICSKLTGPAVVGASGIATNSVHAVFGPTAWTVGIYNGVSLRVIGTGTYSGVPLVADGARRYRAAMRRTAVNTLEVTLPTGAVVVLTDSEIDTWWGPTALIEHYQPSATFATDQRPVILSYAAGSSYRAEAYPNPLLSTPEDWREVGATNQPAFFVNAGARWWENYASATWAPLRFRLVRGIVYVEGMIKANIAPVSGDVLFTLPTGYRPLKTRMMNGYSGSGGAVRFDILNTGNVTWQFGASATTLQWIQAEFWAGT